MSAEPDVVGNIKAIEKMKSNLLSGVSDLYAGMIADAHFQDEKADIRMNSLAEIVIDAYMLGEKLGISYQSLDSKITAKLRLNILEGEDFAQMSPLLKYLEKYRRREQ